MRVGLLVSGTRQHVASGVRRLLHRIAPVLNRDQSPAVEPDRPAGDVAGRVDVRAGRTVRREGAAGSVAGDAAGIRHQSGPAEPTGRPGRTKGRDDEIGLDGAAIRQPGADDPPGRVALERPDLRAGAEHGPGVAQALGDDAPDPGAEAR